MLSANLGLYIPDYFPASVLKLKVLGRPEVYAIHRAANYCTGAEAAHVSHFRMCHTLSLSHSPSSCA